MEKRNGYTQMKLNYMKRYANEIQESVIQMEFAWANKETIASNNDELLDKYLAESRETLERHMEDLKSYMQPFEEEK